MNKLIEDSFEVVGIGLETDFYYGKDVKDIIQKSKNMMIWMLKKHDGLKPLLEAFKMDVVEDLYVLQRI